MAGGVLGYLVDSTARKICTALLLNLTKLTVLSLRRQRRHRQRWR